MPYLSITQICKLNNETEEDHLGYYDGPLIKWSMNNDNDFLMVLGYYLHLIKMKHKICLKLDSLNEKRKNRKLKFE